MTKEGKWEKKEEKRKERKEKGMTRRDEKVEI